MYNGSVSITNKTLFTDMAIFQRSQQLVLLCRLVYTARTCTFHCNSVMLENKVRRTVQGSYLLPLSYERRSVALIFQRFFRGDDGGTLNSIIALFGADPVKWLSNGAINNWCLVFASVWRYIGFDILMFIGAIQSISPDIYEAADLDGANAWQKFWHIIFPGIRTIIALQLILAIKGAASVFEIPYIITGGKMGTSTFVIKTIETGFQYQKIGLASAMAIVLLFIIIVITMIQKIFFKEEK